MASLISHGSMTEPVAPSGGCVGACAPIDPTDSHLLLSCDGSRTCGHRCRWLPVQTSQSMQAHQASLTLVTSPDLACPHLLVSLGPPSQHPLLVRSRARLCLGDLALAIVLGKQPSGPGPKNSTSAWPLAILASVFTRGLQCQALPPQPVYCLRESLILSRAYGAPPCPCC